MPNVHIVNCLIVTFTKVGYVQHASNVTIATVSNSYFVILYIVTMRIRISLALPDRFFPFFFVWAGKKTGKSGLETRD